MTANDHRFLGTLGGFLVDMEFGYPSDLIFTASESVALHKAFWESFQPVITPNPCDEVASFCGKVMAEGIDAAYAPFISDPYPTHAGDTALSCELARDTYKILVEQFDQIESDLNDEGFDDDVLELAQEHLDLAFKALDEVRIHMARFERAITITAFEDDVDCNTDQHALSD